MEGILRIANERNRQRQVEGWTAEHDDKHKDGELAAAARAYLWAAYAQVAFGADGDDIRSMPPPNDWPWSREWWKPSADPIRNLEKAGALVAAEIDRLERAAETPAPPSNPDAHLGAVEA